jgi:hypothetical protein
MTMRDDDFEPGLPAEERDALIRIAAQLEGERPIPAAAFRGDLRRRLVVGDGQRFASRFGLAGTRRLAFASLASGAALLLLAAAGLAHVGPLTPGDAASAVAWVLGST